MAAERAQVHREYMLRKQEALQNRARGRGGILSPYVSHWMNSQIFFVINEKKNILTMLLYIEYFYFAKIGSTDTINVLQYYTRHKCKSHNRDT